MWTTLSNFAQHKYSNAVSQNEQWFGLWDLYCNTGVGLGGFILVHHNVKSTWPTQQGWKCPKYIDLLRDKVKDMHTWRNEGCTATGAKYFTTKMFQSVFLSNPFPIVIERKKNKSGLFLVLGPQYFRGPWRWRKSSNGNGRAIKVLFLIGFLVLSANNACWVPLPVLVIVPVLILVPVLVPESIFW